ncbi:MAG: Nudix family hydrolase [Casimicrobiaceae bacterium]
MSASIVRVAAAVVYRSDGDVLLAQRPAAKPYAGYWEFPGGKLENNETPREALVRELAEELNIVVRRAAPWLVQEFQYPHAHVELHFFRVFAWEGVLDGRDGQVFAWQTPGEFTVAPLLPANSRILAALALPPVYGITRASELGEENFLTRSQRALDCGLKLIQLREKEWPLSRRDSFALRLVAQARRHGAHVLLNGTATDALRLGCAGVHWPAATLAAAQSRPEGIWVAASCHTREDLLRAARLALDFALLGPVVATPTHPDATPLGWDRFATMVAGTRLPVFALGGLNASDLTTAIDHGAHGIALRRGAWND